MLGTSGNGMHTHAGGEVQHSGTKYMRRMWMCHVYSCLVYLVGAQTGSARTGLKALHMIVCHIMLVLFKRNSFDRITNSGTRSQTRISVHRCLLVLRPPPHRTPPRPRVLKRACAM